jgi:hypothetical protein
MTTQHPPGHAESPKTRPDCSKKQQPTPIPGACPPPSILSEAARIVDGDREHTYGDPGRNLRTIANLWDSWLLARGWSGPGLSTDDVALLMVLLKIARLANQPTHRDSQVDICGYARLLERIQASNSTQPGTLGRT